MNRAAAFTLGTLMLLGVASSTFAQSQYDASKGAYVFRDGWDRVDPNGAQSPNRLGTSLSVHLGNRVGNRYGGAGTAYTASGFARTTAPSGGGLARPAMASQPVGTIPKPAGAAPGQSVGAKASANGAAGSSAPTTMLTPFNRSAIGGSSAFSPGIAAPAHRRGGGNKASASSAPAGGVSTGK